METQGDSKLRKLQVRSGYELLLEERASKSAQTILSYNATPRHNHRLTLDIRSARLSDETLGLLAMLNPPRTAGRLIYARDPSETTERRAFLPHRLQGRVSGWHQMDRRSVAIAPPTREDVLDSSTTRLVHVVSTSPLAIRLSANSPDGADGPGCHYLLSIGSWQQVNGQRCRAGSYNRSCLGNASISRCRHRLSNRAKTSSNHSRSNICCRSGSPLDPSASLG